jgi:type VI secretion system secreted protein Hcp
MGLYLKMKSVAGDATEKNHKDWIKCDSFRFGSKRQVYTPLGRVAFREGRTGKLGEVEITKDMDTASSNLFMATCHGEGETMQLDITRAGSGGDKGEVVYVSYELSNAILTGYGFDVGATGSNRETLRLNFTKVKMVLTPQDAKLTGKGSIPVTFCAETGTGEG